jgi:hypothetical protein
MAKEGCRLGRDLAPPGQLQSAARPLLGGVPRRRSRRRLSWPGVLRVPERFHPVGR